MLFRQNVANSLAPAQASNRRKLLDDHSMFFVSFFFFWLVSLRVHVKPNKLLRYPETDHSTRRDTRYAISSIIDEIRVKITREPGALHGQTELNHWCYQTFVCFVFSLVQLRCTVNRRVDFQFGIGADTDLKTHIFLFTKRLSTDGSFQTKENFLLPTTVFFLFFFFFPSLFAPNERISALFHCALFL